MFLNIRYSVLEIHQTTKVARYRHWKYTYRDYVFVNVPSAHKSESSDYLHIIIARCRTIIVVLNCLFHQRYNVP